MLPIALLMPPSQRLVLEVRTEEWGFARKREEKGGDCARKREAAQGREDSHMDLENILQKKVINTFYKFYHYFFFFFFLSTENILTFYQCFTMKQTLKNARNCFQKIFYNKTNETKMKMIVH